VNPFGAIQSVIPVEVLFWVLIGLALGYYATSHWLLTGGKAA
jgi:hypothetical protein